MIFGIFFHSHHHMVVPLYVRSISKKGRASIFDRESSYRKEATDDGENHDGKA